MAQFRVYRIGRGMGFRAWAILVAALLLTFLILSAIFALALGLLMFVLPAIAVVALFYYIFPSKLRRGPPGPPTIEGNYRVMDPAPNRREQDLP